MNIISRLQSEILRLEFERKEPNEDGFISEKQFAELLLTYADYSPRKRTIVLKRIKKLFKVNLKTFSLKCLILQTIYRVISTIHNGTFKTFFLNINKNINN